MRNLHELIPYPELENWQKALIVYFIQRGMDYRIRVTRVRKEVRIQRRRMRWGVPEWETQQRWNTTDMTIRQMRERSARFDPATANWQIL